MPKLRRAKPRKKNANVAIANAPQAPNLGKFDGSTPTPRASTWFAIFRITVEGLGDDAAKITALLGYLSGDALEFYGTAIAPNRAVFTLDDVERRFRERFEETGTLPVVTAIRMKHTCGTPVKTYFDAKMSLLQRTHMSDREKADLLTEGVAYDLQSSLNAADIDSPAKG